MIDDTVNITININDTVPLKLYRELEWKTIKLKDDLVKHATYIKQLEDALGPNRVLQIQLAHAEEEKK